MNSLIIEPNGSEMKSQGGIILPPAPELVVTSTMPGEEQLVPPEFQDYNVPILGLG